MSKIFFLIPFFIVGCSTPEIHIPSYSFGGETNSTENEESSLAETAPSLPVEEANSSMVPLTQVVDLDMPTEKEKSQSKKSKKREKQEREKLAKEKQEREKLEKEKLEKEREEAERLERDRIEKERAQRESQEGADESQEKEALPYSEADSKDTSPQETYPSVIKNHAKEESEGGFFSFFRSKKKVRNEYFTGGKIRSKLVMSDKTGESGLLYKYGYDGKVTSTVYIKHGLKNGLETLFDSKERAIKRTPYINGQKEGIVEVYYPDGKVLAQITYVKNKRHGRASKYNHDGSINEEVKYVHGKVQNVQDDPEMIEIPTID